MHKERNFNLEINVIMDYVCSEEKKDYKCYDTLKNLLLTNEDFKNIIIEGIKEGKIQGFSDNLWEKLAKQNLRAPGVNSFVDVLIDGFNQGYCTVASKQVSYSLDNCDICGGILPILAGTANCPDGRHTWIEEGNKIIDTTLMLVIDSSYKSSLGYQEENRYNPNTDPIYASAKMFTNDSSLRRGGGK